MGDRVKCPRERNARLGQCERVGCNHLSGARSRVCGCCAVGCGPTMVARLSMLRQHGTVEQVLALEDEVLAKLNAIPLRRRLGISGWGSP